MPQKLQVINKTTDFGKAVELVETKIVDPEPDEVRVRQIYSGVNATDINITAARYFTDGVVPYSIGLEGVGVVDAVGANVTKLKVGQAVAVLHSGKKQEGFSNYTNQKADFVFPIPSVDPKYIALLVCGLTASIGLDKCGRIQPGDKVLITAAAGGTGHIAAQWAKNHGCYVIGTASTPEKEEYLKGFCDYVINYRKENLGKVLSEKFPQGIDVVWETIGGETHKTLFEHLAMRGRMVLVGSIENYMDGSPRGGLIENLHSRIQFKAQSVNGFILFAFTDLIPEYFQKLVTAVDKGDIKIRIDLGERSGTPFEGLENVVKAENWLHSSKNIGKVTVKIGSL